MSDKQWTSAFEPYNLSRSDDPRDFVYRVVAAIAQGEPVLLTLGTVQGVIISALHSGTLRQVLENLATSVELDSVTLLLNDQEQLADWVPALGIVGKRLARRVWPGTTTLLFPKLAEGGLLGALAEDVLVAVAPADVVAFRVPEETFVRDVLRLVAGPVVLRTLSIHERNEANFLDKMSRVGVKLVGEMNDAPEVKVGTVARVDGDHFSVLRAGDLDQSTLARLAGTLILFVCTGNTCRSPMAEAICKVLISERLKCPVTELEARGYAVLSAGIAANSGMPAASHALDVVRVRGGSLSEHASRKLTLDLIRSADHILAMTGDHLEAMIDHAPEASAKMSLLHPEGHDVADPVGADRDTYLRSAKAIESYLVRWLDSLNL